jgi:hypothetical protein
MAAVLIGGADAVLSHRSAAALWGLCDDDRRVVDVTVPRRIARARSDIRLHSGTTLGREDRTIRDGIPCTALPRTLIDLATQVDGRLLLRVIDRAEELRLFDGTLLEAVLARERGRRGVRTVADVLARYGDPTITKSEAEERLLAIVAEAGLPTPEVNAWIALAEGGGYSPDFLWRDRRLIVEIDGRAYHARRDAFEHDRRRDRRLAISGFETRRYAASELSSDPRGVARELRTFLVDAPPAPR